MAAKSKKGGAFEREFCKDLSRWWTNGARDDIFWRTSGSGGRATIRRRKGLSTANSAGDILALDPVGEPFLDVFCCELKRGYSKHTPYDIVDRANNAAIQQFEDWYSQAHESKQAASSLSWLIISRRDQRVAVAIMPFDMLDDIRARRADKKLPRPLMIMDVYFRRKQGAKFQRRNERVVCMPLSNFFEYTRPEHVISIAACI